MHTLITHGALLLFLIGCGGAGSETAAGNSETVTAANAESAAADGTSSTDSAVDAPAEVPTDTMTATKQEEKPMDSYRDKIAELETEKGTIVVRFFPDAAPNHVKNFIDLANSGFYNGTRFHRIIPGFVIQGGDPNTKSNDRSLWGTGGSPKNVKAEFNAIPHKRGILSMARSQSPDSASSQFFVCVADARSLDNQYTVFGEVLSGMEFADAIVSGKAVSQIAVDPVKLVKVTIRDAKEGEKSSK